MSDDRLRELERRWQESESPEDEAAWLAERVRRGTLESRAIELAARLGHFAAAQLIEAQDQRDRGVQRDWRSSLERWGAELGAFGEETALRAGLAASLHAVRVADFPDWQRATVMSSLDLLSCYVDRPDEGHLPRLEYAAGDLYPGLDPEEDDCAWGRCFALGAAFKTLQLVAGEDYGSLLGDALDRAARVKLSAAGLGREILLDPSLSDLPPLPSAAEQVVREVVREALVPWALGGQAQLAPPATPPIWRRLWWRLTGASE